MRRSRPRLCTILSAIAAAVAALPAAAQAPQLDRIQLLPDGSVPGGVPIKGEVWLQAPAPRETVVRLTSSTPNLVRVPDTATVLIGQQVARFRVDTSAVGSPSTVRLTAEVRGSSTATKLVVVPPEVSRVGFDPSVVVVGSSATATIGLKGLAPQSGWVVAISQQPDASCVFHGSGSGTIGSGGQITTAQPVLDFPAQATVPSGAKSTSFPVSATSLPEGAVQCRVTFRATADGHSATGELKVSVGLFSG